MANDAVGHLEKCYSTKVGYWKHGGIVGVLGYGGGVIGRYSELGNEFPGVAHFHTIRLNQPSGFFYTSKALKEICDIWDKYGSGLTNMHGSTGDLVLLGCRTESLEAIFAEYSSRGWDLAVQVQRSEPRAAASDRAVASGQTMIRSISHTRSHRNFRMRCTGRHFLTNSR